MKMMRIVGGVACAALVALGACGGDETQNQGGNPPDGGNGGTGNTGNQGGTGNVGNQGGTGNVGGMGGNPPLPMCGDGAINGTDVCDDGNTDVDDGCSDTCTVEAGWNCDAADPTVCTAICGDFMIVGAEICDDGNAVAGDGCSDVCAYEATCQNGIVEPGETCDDSNATAGDGCDATCQLEAGNVCGDAIDLNDPTNVTVAGKTLTYQGDTTGSAIINYSVPSCRFGTGSEDAPTNIHKWTATQPSLVTLQTNLINGAGIDDTLLWGHVDCLGTSDEAFCDEDSGPGFLSVTEPFFVPAGQTLFILVASWGAGGADVYELEMNITPVQVAPGGSTCAAPNAIGVGQFYGTVTTSDPSNFEPSCLAGSQGASEAVFELTLANATNVVISAGGVPGSAYNIALHLQDGVCDPANAVEYACSDQVVFGRPELIAETNVPAGTYYVVVDGSNATAEGPYLLDVQTSTCGDGTTLKPIEECDDMNMADGDGCSSACVCEPFLETEPNDTDVTANVVAAGICLVNADIDVGADEDYFAVTLAAGETLTATVVAGATDTCGPSGSIDSEIEIYDTNGTSSLVFNDDISGSNNYCSSASYTSVAGGQYFVRVSNSSSFCNSCLFDYGLSIGIE
jgi:cysteine-rich repeat protein